MTAPLLLALLFALLGLSSAATNWEHPIRFRKNSPTLTVVYYISPTLEYVPQQTEQFPTTSFEIYSSVSHTFAAVEVQLDR